VGFFIGGGAESNRGPSGLVDSVDCINSISKASLYSTLRALRIRAFKFVGDFFKGSSPYFLAGYFAIFFIIFGVYFSEIILFAQLKFFGVHDG